MDYRKDYYRGIAGFYFRRILNTIISLGDLKHTNGPILDFGCGVGKLRQALGNKVIGYDIIPELSDIVKYQTVKPNVIVCNNILEHITAAGIDQLVKDFKIMNPRVRLITAIPTENRLSRIGMTMTGLGEAHNDHVTKLKDINNILSKHFTHIMTKRIFTLNEVSLWMFK